MRIFEYVPEPPSLRVHDAEAPAGEQGESVYLLLLRNHYWWLQRRLETDQPPQRELPRLQQPAGPQHQSPPGPPQLLGASPPGPPRAQGGSEGGQGGKYRARQREDTYGSNPMVSSEARMAKRARQQGALAGAAVKVMTLDEKQLFEELYLALRPLYPDSALWKVMADQWNRMTERAALVGAKANIRAKQPAHLRAYADRLRQAHEQRANTVCSLTGLHPGRSQEQRELRLQLIQPAAVALPVPPRVSVAQSRALLDPALLPPPVPAYHAIMSDPQVLAQLGGGSSRRGAYNCSACGQPKKGHKCRALQ